MLVRMYAAISISTLFMIAGCGSGAGDAEPAAEKAVLDLLVLTPGELGRLGVEDVVLAEASTEAEILAPAHVLLDPRRHAKISSLVEGRVKNVLVGQGERVRAGQALATIESMSVGQLIAEFLVSSARNYAAAAELRRLSTLRAEKIASEKQFDLSSSEAASAAAEYEAAAKKMLAAGFSRNELDALLKNPEGFEPVLKLKSPINGIVAGVSISIGAEAGPSIILFEVVDPAVVLVEGNIFEKDMPFVSTGQEVIFETQSYPGRIYAGRLQSIGAVIDEKSHTLPVRCEVRNTDGGLKPNLFGRLSIKAGNSRRALMLPLDALVYDGKERRVFVRINDSTYAYRKIDTGKEADGRIEILAGLQEGDRIAGKGGFNRKSRLKLSGGGEE